MKKIFIIGIILLLFCGIASAEVIDITIKGTVIENGEKQNVYNVGLERRGNNSEYLSTDYVEVNSSEGFNVHFDYNVGHSPSISINYEGYCPNQGYGLSYYITRENGKFVVTDFLDPTNKKTFSGTTIDLGNINEVHKGGLRVNTDVAVDLDILNSTGNSIGGNTFFLYQHDLSDYLERGKNYKLVLTTQTGTRWEKDFTSATNYCDTTLLTKTGENITQGTCTTDCPETQGGKVDYKFYKGWNLVSASLLGLMSSSSDSCYSLWKAIFLYNPTYNGYLGMKGVQPNSTYIPDRETFDKYFNTYTENWTQHSYSDVLTMAAYWIYYDNDCTTKLSLDRLGSYDQATIRDTINKNEVSSKLLKGWNFIGTAQWMEGSNFKTIFEDCEIEKANYFNNVTQTWGRSSSTTYAQEFANNASPIYLLTGKAYVIKVKNDCYIKYNHDNSLAPPNLPN